jgi:predicted ArsR family transcriptional regulator
MPLRVASASRVLGSASRVEILHVLQQADGPVAVDVVAAQVTRHPNTVREHLDRLVAARFAVRTCESRTTRGRPRMLYEAVPRAAGATLDERVRASLTRLLLSEYDDLDQFDDRTPEAGGPSDGTSIAGLTCADVKNGGSLREQLAALEVHLEDVGFDPQIDTDGRTVHLHRCPFENLARDRTEVMCAVHLDVVRGVMAEQGGPLTAERLEPFVGPQHCLLHLRTL